MELINQTNDSSHSTPHMELPVVTDTNSTKETTTDTTNTTDATSTTSTTTTEAITEAITDATTLDIDTTTDTTTTDTTTTETKTTGTKTITDTTTEAPIQPCAIPIAPTVTQHPLQYQAGTYAPFYPQRYSTYLYSPYPVSYQQSFVTQPYSTYFPQYPAYTYPPTVYTLPIYTPLPTPYPIPTPLPTAVKPVPKKRKLEISESELVAMFEGDSVPDDIFEKMEPFMELQLPASALQRQDDGSRGVILQRGSLLDSDCDMVIHCCNCFHKMDAGIASKVKRNFSKAFETDKRTPKNDRRKLGHYSAALVDDIITFINLYAQFDYGTSARKINYAAMRLGLQRMVERLQQIDNAYPKIGTYCILNDMGCYHSGGSKEIVTHILNSVFVDYPVYLFTDKQ